MPDYRIYTLSSGNRIAGPPQVIACDDDVETIARTKRLIDGHDVEIWQGARVVIRLNATDKSEPFSREDLKETMVRTTGLC